MPSQVTKKDQKYVNILDINILSTTEHELLTAIEQKLTDSSKFSILTPNPELILASTKNKALKEALNSTTFSVPDAIGLSQAAKFLTLRSPKNILLRLVTTFFQGMVVGVSTLFNQGWLTSELKPFKGRILFERLIQLAVKNDLKVFLLGGLSNEAVLAAENLISKYPTIIISTSKGPQLNDAGESDTKVDIKIQSDVIDRINMLKPDLLFVAFGNPKQEIWIHKNLSKLDIGGAMAVGGTFRYVAGLTPLPPKWMENLGLEWVWRLITEPYRFTRIFNAFPLFPLKVLIWKLNNRNF